MRTTNRRANPARSRDDALHVLREAAAELGRTPSIGWWRANRRQPCAKTVAKLCGSWNEAVRLAGLTPCEQGPTLRYTLDGVCHALREAAAELGRTPDVTWWSFHKRRPTLPTIIRLCGSWKEALDLAGLPQNPKGGCIKAEHVTDEQILERLREAAGRLGRTPTTGWWTGTGMAPTVDTVTHRFGGWSAALAAAGLTPNAAPEKALEAVARRRARTREAVLAELRSASDTHGGPISAQQWNRDGRRPCTATVMNLFGGWGNAWRAAGVPYVGQRDREAKRATALQTLREAHARHGRTLSASEWGSLGLKPNQHTLTQWFGGWLAAWRAAGIDYRPAKWKKSDAVQTLTAVADRLDLNVLPERQRTVVDAVLHGATLQEAGEQAHITREGARQIVLKVVGRTDPEAQPPAKRSRSRIDDEEILAALRAAAAELGRAPTLVWWRQYTIPPQDLP